MTPFTIAGMQLSLPAGQDNIARIGSKLDFLMQVYPWVQMAVVSELAALGPSPSLAQPMPGPAEDRFREMARRHGIWLLPGTLMEKTPDGVFNTAPVIDPKGEVTGRFRKLFPFRPYETEVQAGREFLVFDVPGVGRFGVSICYDMWFPETSRQLVALGAEVILHPSMTWTIDRDVELSIARATAAQNQCFLFDINGAGGIGNGRSIIVGPAGDVQYQAGEAEELIPLEIDLDRVRRSREVGLRGLGQPLKSFRDRAVEFEVYGQKAGSSPFLDRLGELRKPERGDRAGLKQAGKEPS